MWFYNRLSVNTFTNYPFMVTYNYVEILMKYTYYADDINKKKWNEIIRKPFNILLLYFVYIFEFEFHVK